MNSPKCSCSFLMALLLGALTISLCSQDAAAQGTRAKPRGDKGAGRTPVRPGEKPLPPTPGNEIGTILKFKPAKEADQEKGVSGHLTVKPFEKGAKVLRLAVLKPNDDGEGGVIVKVGEYTFDLEDLSDVFWKGLYCTAGWGYQDESARIKVKELRLLTLDTIDVVGKVEAIEDELVIIRAVPRDGNDWPHLEAMNKAKPQAAGAKPKPIRKIKMKLKLIDDVSKLMDDMKEEATLSYFEPGQEVHAKVVFSTKTGMLIQMSPPIDESKIQERQPEEPPPPREQQPKTRGGGRRASGG